MILTKIFFQNDVLNLLNQSILIDQEKNFESLLNEKKLNKTRQQTKQVIQQRTKKNIEEKLYQE